MKEEADKIKTQQQSDFDDQISLLAPNDHLKLLELFEKIHRENPISCSAAVNRLVKWLVKKKLIDDSFSNKICRNIYRDNNLPQICLGTQSLTEAEWKDMVMTVVFQKRLISSLKASPEISVGANVALMASAVIHPSVVELMCMAHGDMEKFYGRSILDDGAQDKIWSLIRGEVNKLAKSLTNPHLGKYSELAFMNPR